jgi:hypothetical protein
MPEVTSYPKHHNSFVYTNNIYSHLKNIDNFINNVSSANKIKIAMLTQSFSPTILYKLC